MRIKRLTGLDDYRRAPSERPACLFRLLRLRLGAGCRSSSRRSKPLEQFENPLDIVTNDRDVTEHPLGWGIIGQRLDALLPATLDPVFEMTIDPADAPAQAHYRGRTINFCCAGCADSFPADSDRYLPEGATDPICNMAITPASAAGHRRGNDGSVWFCSPTAPSSGTPPAASPSDLGSAATEERKPATPNAAVSSRPRNAFDPDTPVGRSSEAEAHKRIL